MASVYTRSGSKNYWLSYHDENGKLIRRSAGTTNKSLAEEMLVEIEAKIMARVAAKTGVDESPPAAKGPVTNADLELRLRNLEVLVRRLAIHHSFQAQMFEFWGRKAAELVPAELKTGETRFFVDDEGDGGEDHGQED